MSKAFKTHHERLFTCSLSGFLTITHSDGALILGWVCGELVNLDRLITGHLQPLEYSKVCIKWAIRSTVSSLTVQNQLVLSTATCKWLSLSHLAHVAHADT